MRKRLALATVASLSISAAPFSNAQDVDIWDGSFTEAQALQGKNDFSAHCASCHAVDLRGNSNTPSLLGMSFMFIWEGRTLAELYNKMRDDMPSDRPASLSTNSYESLLAFILQANNFPTGSQALSSDNGLLERTIISAPTAQ